MSPKPQIPWLGQLSMSKTAVRLSLFSFAAFVMSVAYAHQPSIVENWVRVQSPPGVQAGVVSAKIETHDLTAAEKKRIKLNMATVSVTAQAFDVKVRRGEPARALGLHTVCFGTFLTTEADYNFVLNVGGNQTNIANHIVIPANKRTCVTLQTYQFATFPFTGNYMYTASSYGSTFSSGQWDAHSTAYITVQ